MANLSDTEIIKALECCCVAHRCSECSYNITSAICITNLMTDALDLINRQKAENEKLADTLNATIAGQETLQRYIETAKSEARKEFAKFLIDKSENGVIYISDLPDYVKETG